MYNAHLSRTDGHSVRGDRVLPLSADIFPDGRLTTESLYNQSQSSIKDKQDIIIV